MRRIVPEIKVGGAMLTSEASIAPIKGANVISKVGM
jgi:hypothetical protein